PVQTERFNGVVTDYTNRSKDSDFRHGWLGWARIDRFLFVIIREIRGQKNPPQSPIRFSRRYDSVGFRWCGSGVATTAPSRPDRCGAERRQHAWGQAVATIILERTAPPDQLRLYLKRFGPTKTGERPMRSPWLPRARRTARGHTRAVTCRCRARDRSRVGRAGRTRGFPSPGRP